MGMRLTYLRRHLVDQGLLPTDDQTLSGQDNKTWPQLKEFWCGHYLDPNKQPIPDGAECCFMHWRGLPRRWGKRHPLYSWEIRVVNDIRTGTKYIFVLKPPKLGATELFLSFAIWKALSDPSWTNGQVGILVGTSIGETEQMIGRCKEILAVKDSNGIIKRNAKGDPIYRVPLHYSYNNKKEFTVNTVRFMAHSAGHYDAIRAKPNMRMIIGDEIAFFIRRKEDQKEIRSAFEHNLDSILSIVPLNPTDSHKRP